MYVFYCQIGPNTGDRSLLGKVHDTYLESKMDSLYVSRTCDVHVHVLLLLTKINAIIEDFNHLFHNNMDFFTSKNKRKRKTIANTLNFVQGHYFVKIRRI